MANKNANEVAVVREYTSRVGSFEISRNSSNQIVIVSGENTLTLPNGRVGSAILEEAVSFLVPDAPAKGKNAAKKDGNAPKRTRRTKAEMEAARAAGSTASGEAEGAEPELETV